MMCTLRELEQEDHRCGFVFQVNEVHEKVQ
jgi:hypothetical protein